MQKTEIMKKFFGLRETRLADCAMDIYWADYWSGSLGTHPGSGTGSQTLEGFHSFWQSLLSKRTRQSPCNVLQMMQELFTDHWGSYMLGDEQPGSSLWPKSPEAAFLNGTALHRQGMSSAAEYWAHRHGSNVWCDRAWQQQVLGDAQPSVGHRNGCSCSGAACNGQALGGSAAHVRSRSGGSFGECEDH